MKHIKPFAAALILSVASFLGIQSFAQTSGRSPEQKNLLIKYLSNQIKRNEAVPLLLTQSELSAALNRFGDAKTKKFYPLATFYFFTGGLSVYNSMDGMIDFNDDFLSVFGGNAAVFRNINSDKNREYVFIEKKPYFTTTIVYTLIDRGDGHYDIVENVYSNGDQTTCTRYTDDYEFQQKYYAENAQYANPGINFYADTNSSSTTSSSRSTSTGRSSKANCTYCGGTGYYLSQSSTSGSMIGHSPLYNSAGSVCRICGSTNAHWHHECKH